MEVCSKWVFPEVSWMDFECFILFPRMSWWPSGGIFGFLAFLTSFRVIFFVLLWSHLVIILASFWNHFAAGLLLFWPHFAALASPRLDSTYLFVDQFSIVIRCCYTVFTKRHSNGNGHSNANCNGHETASNSVCNSKSHSHNYIFANRDRPDTSIPCTHICFSLFLFLPKKNLSPIESMFAWRESVLW